MINDGEDTSTLQMFLLHALLTVAVSPYLVSGLNLTTQRWVEKCLPHS